VYGQQKHLALHKLIGSNAIAVGIGDIITPEDNIVIYFTSGFFPALEYEKDFPPTLGIY
jgi:hypothetical protein|tara:strand:- start:18 stop:194 length:177 start_codon:yes stop_codon:yes gene_type:complete